MNAPTFLLTFLSLGLWAWCVGRLLLYKREPTGTLAWLLFVTLFPVVGPLIFLMIGTQRLRRKAIKRKRRLEAAVPSETEIEAKLKAKTPALPPLESRLIRLASQISEYAVTEGNEVEIIADPAVGLQAMRDAVKGAKQFIHLEYYIIESDAVTQDLFDDLTDACRRGVEVRILYDAFGSLSLKRLALRKLEKGGVKVAGFLPFRFFPQHINPNFRNHRKILVVDGRTAFTGGANIGRHYLGRPSRHQWRDYIIRVQGPVCTQLQEVFAKDWFFTTKEDLFHEKYQPAPERPGTTTIQVIESGPDTRFNVLHNLLFLALNSAEKEILLTTPYFIPDPALSSSLMVAALKGIRVQLLLPEKSDAPLAQMASRSFYDDLLDAGVSIHHYQPTILHAKMLCIDGKWSMFGSANMDIRSFRLNFELNLLMFGGKVSEQAAGLFRGDQKRSTQVDVTTFARRNLTTRLAENACRLLSPVL